MDRYQAFEHERELALAADRRGDPAAAERHWSRAHILGQPRIGPHLRTHIALAKLYARQRRFAEARGQVWRFLLVVPGTLLRRLPVGNSGLSNVSAFQPMPVPPDLEQVIRSDSRGEH